MLKRHTGQHVNHGDAQQRHSQRQADPKSARHVAQLRIVLLDGSYSARFKRHAADRTRSGAGTNDLRVHGAGVFNPAGRNRSFRFERHPTFRARPRFVLPYFRTHRTNVASVRKCGCIALDLCATGRLGRGRGNWLSQGHQAGMGDALLFPCFVLCWIGFKLLRAVGTTEVISFPGVLELIPRCGRIDGHATNRVRHGSRRIGGIFHV